MPRDFHRSILLAQGLEKVSTYLTEGIERKLHPIFPAEIEISLMFSSPTISDGGYTAEGLVETTEAIRKATFLRDFLASAAGIQAIVCTDQNAFDLNWVSTSNDEVYLCRYDERGWSEPNFILTSCRFHTYRITPA